MLTFSTTSKNEDSILPVARWESANYPLCCEFSIDPTPQPREFLLLLCGVSVSQDNNGWQILDLSKSTKPRNDNKSIFMLKYENEFNPIVCRNAIKITFPASESVQRRRFKFGIVAKSFMTGLGFSHHLQVLYHPLMLEVPINGKLSLVPSNDFIFAFISRGSNEENNRILHQQLQGVWNISQLKMQSPAELRAVVLQKLSQPQVIKHPRIPELSELSLTPVSLTSPRPNLSSSDIVKVKKSKSARKSKSTKIGKKRVNPDLITNLNSYNTFSTFMNTMSASRNNPTPLPAIDGSGENFDYIPQDMQPMNYMQSNSTEQGQPFILYDSSLLFATQDMQPMNYMQLNFTEQGQPFILYDGSLLFLQQDIQPTNYMQFNFTEQEQPFMLDDVLESFVKEDMQPMNSMQSNRTEQEQPFMLDDVLEFFAQ